MCYSFLSFCWRRLEILWFVCVLCFLFWREAIIHFLSPLTEIPGLFCSSVTELLILAHSCFSLTCHMEGITRVLQAARLLTEEHLAPKEEYGLVVSVCGAGGAACACPVVISGEMCCSVSLGCLGISNSCLEGAPGGWVSVRCQC